MDLYIDLDTFCFFLIGYRKILVSSCIFVHTCAFSWDTISDRNIEGDAQNTRQIKNFFFLLFKLPD